MSDLPSVHIGDVQTTVRAVDGDSLVTPQMMEKILRVVLQAIDEREEHRRRVRAENRITRGVSHELAEEAW